MCAWIAFLYSSDSLDPFLLLGCDVLNVSGLSDKIFSVCCFQMKYSFVNTSSLRHIMNTVLPAVGISELHNSVSVECCVFSSEDSMINSKII